MLKAEADSGTTVEMVGKEGVASGPLGMYAPEPNAPPVLPALWTANAPISRIWSAVKGVGTANTADIKSPVSSPSPLNEKCAIVL